MADQLSARALCEIEDVRPHVHKLVDDIEDDDVLIPLINAASAAIHRISGREFKLDGAASQTRVFDLIRDSLRPAVLPEELAGPHRARDIPRTLRVGDMKAKPTKVEVYKADGATLVKDVALADVDDLPRPRLSSDPMTRLRFRSSVPLSSDSVVKVTGAFGWPSVPDDIVQACAQTAAAWFAQDAQRYSETFAAEEAEVRVTRALPQRAFDIVVGYKLDL